MRTTIVPAQITTVEDRIAGRLGLSQLLLLILPIFGGSGIFVILPPFFNYAVYKLVIIVCMVVLCGLLAIRIKGKILLFWGITLLRYNLRPRYYVFNKNSAHTRDVITQAAIPVEATEEAKTPKVVRAPLPQLSTAELVAIETILANPDANLHFKTDKKGALSVSITEIQQESVSATAN
jgi:hypothetical protein